jgi:hypothetical protein
MQTRSFWKDEFRDSHVPSRDGRPGKTRLVQLSFAVILATLAALTLPPLQTSISAESQDTPTVRISVLGLFHPHQLTVTALPGQALVLHTPAGEFVLEKSSGTDSATLRLDNDSIALTAGHSTIQASSITITGRNTDPTGLVLSVPQKLTRRYRGTLEIRPSRGSLLAIVTMDRETAVASVLAAEATGDTPLEALKAEAIAIRSYFVAGRARHHEFDFCDTTHCQFLREPPSPASLAAKAVAATHGLVLAYDSQPFAAMYTRSCSGRTHTLAELHLPSSNYPYYTVECPTLPRSPGSLDDPHLRRGGPRPPAPSMNALGSTSCAALAGAPVPSNDFTETKDGDSFILSGVGQGTRPRTLPIRCQGHGPGWRHFPADPCSLLSQHQHRHLAWIVRASSHHRFLF